MIEPYPDWEIRAVMAERMRLWLLLSPAKREQRRQAVRARDGFDWRLPGEDVIPWSRRQRQKPMRDR